jgi:hypothetical protein
VGKYVTLGSSTESDHSAEITLLASTKRAHAGIDICAGILYFRPVRNIGF